MTVAELQTQIYNELVKHSGESARLESEMIVCRALGSDRVRLILDAALEADSETVSKAETMCMRRIADEPLAYIFGEKEFFGFTFKVNQNVLIPRPETELLVERALSLLPDNGSLLDICTGSGAVAVAVKRTRPDISVTAGDISKEALDVAEENARILAKGNIEIVLSDLFASFGTRRFDVITANPPYVDEALRGTLQKDLEYEPDIALYADDGGSAIIKRIIASVKEYLSTDGFFLMELGYDQGEAVKKLCADAGLECGIIKDYAGIDRIAEITFS